MGHAILNQCLDFRNYLFDLFIGKTQFTQRVVKICLTNLFTGETQIAN